MRYFYSAVNIFTDASICKDKNDLYIISGFVVVYKDSIINSGIEVYKTTVENGRYFNVTYGELSAIYNAVKAVTKLYSDKPVNIFSDSLASINMIRNHIPKYLKRCSNRMCKDKLIKSYYAPLVATILNELLENNLDIQFLHILSHCDSANVEDAWAFKNDFVKHNKVPIEFLDEVVVQSLVYYNSVVDFNIKQEIGRFKAGKELDCKAPLTFCAYRTDMFTQESKEYLDYIWA